MFGRPRLWERTIPDGHSRRSRLAQLSQTAQERARFASILASRADLLWLFRFPVTSPPVPKYRSSDVRPAKAECGSESCAPRHRSRRAAPTPRRCRAYSGRATMPRRSNSKRKSPSPRGFVSARLIVEEPNDRRIDMPEFVGSLRPNADFGFRRVNSLTRSPPTVLAHKPVPCGGRGVHFLESLRQKSKRTRRHVTILGRCHHFPNRLNLIQSQLMWKRLRATTLVFKLTANFTASRDSLP